MNTHYYIIIYTKNTVIPFQMNYRLKWNDRTETKLLRIVQIYQSSLI